MKKKLLRRLALIIICLLLIFTALSECKKKSSKPILQFRVDTDFGFYILKYRKTYVLYDDGRVRRTVDYDTDAEVETHGINAEPDAGEAYLYFFDPSTPDGQKLNEIAQHIVILTKQNERNVNFLELYLIDSKYYYTAWIDDGKNRVCGLFEYRTSDNSIKKIVTFDYYISLLEPYHE